MSRIGGMMGYGCLRMRGELRLVVGMAAEMPMGLSESRGILPLPPSTPVQAGIWGAGGETRMPIGDIGLPAARASN